MFWRDDDDDEEEEEEEETNSFLYNVYFSFTWSICYIIQNIKFAHNRREIYFKYFIRNYSRAFASTTGLPS